MPEMNDIVKLAVDSYRGRVEKYSKSETQEVLRQALIEANGGSTALDLRKIRDGECKGLFALLEQILSVTVVEGLQRSDFFMNMVEFRNVKEGDSPIFRIKDKTLFQVSESADGTTGVRRQRLGGDSEMTLRTSLKSVRIYEELNRILSGRVDFNDAIALVSESFEQKLLNEIYDLWRGATADQMGGAAYFPAAGSFSEDALLDVIAHVEAAAGGATATIVGTKKALRKIAPSITGIDYEHDMYNLGYAGKFYGSPVLAMAQRHKVGTTDFVADDNTLTIVATGESPIKCVYEGDPIILMGDPMSNPDLTQEFFFAEKYGTAIILPGQNTGLGRYEFA